MSGEWQTKFNVSSRLRSQSQSHKVKARESLSEPEWAWARAWPEPELDKRGNFRDFIIFEKKLPRLSPEPPLWRPWPWRCWRGRPRCRTWSASGPSRAARGCGVLLWRGQWGRGSRGAGSGSWWLRWVAWWEAQLVISLDTCLLVYTCGQAQPYTCLELSIMVMVRGNVENIWILGKSIIRYAVSKSVYQIVFLYWIFVLFLVYLVWQEVYNKVWLVLWTDKYIIWEDQIISRIRQ
mgnify:CR=1 FL=1